MNRLLDAVFYDNAPLFARACLWSCEVDAFGKRVDAHVAAIDSAIARIDEALFAREARHG